MKQAMNYKHDKEVYDRIVNKKLALIAVSNKRLKQTFAIAKSSHLYDANFASVLLVKL